ncbi:isocitrate lyase/phosphoenolpyruvate mutase family protein (plasmid) [Deinococcus taeanensis]|uniref:isocitrate lyase/PEP mutase family protein n=1 Tax=Deinococcus taeanensis TaxID=2737050 RepID=UPI001CDC84BE|nr:isocitrate lyase/phosphoenolpyruvate mutase family protein [Deinococcus taeanensis]UBV45106.1 isocitrate lyase/phosphoenolpyruvate mutase family protein [Deinococcus taeanensis]
MTITPLSIPASLAQRFQQLHQAERGFLLPNAWDSASARLFQAAGFPAIGTTSAGIAYARGRQDGQSLSREEMCREVAAIVSAVGLPVNADIEAGYGDAPADVARSVTDFTAAGAVGLNLEDATGSAHQPLYALEDQQRRLEAARTAADATGVPVYLNARTDTYISGFGASEAERLAETVRRGRAYLSAGADSVFVPLVTDPATIRLLVSELGGAVAVMAFPGAPSVGTLLDAGATRVSLGQSVMLATLGLTARIARELQESGTSEAMQGSFYGFDEAEHLFGLV